MIKEQIMNYILTNEYINNYLSKVKENYRDEFKQHFYLEILESMEVPIKLQKLETLFHNNGLGKWCNAILKNQLISNTSSFHKLHRKNHLNIINADIFDIQIDIPIDPPPENYKKEQYHKIVTLLNQIQPFDAILFKMYYGINTITNEPTKPMTYRQIQDKVSISYQAVRLSVMTTKKTIQERIK